MKRTICFSWLSVFAVSLLLATGCAGPAKEEKGEERIKLQPILMGLEGEWWQCVHCPDRFRRWKAH